MEDGEEGSAIVPVEGFFLRPASIKLRKSRKEKAEMEPAA